MTRRVLLLGGLDPSGGAGITVDALVVALHGAAPLPLATALTVQGDRGFAARHSVPAAIWRRQLDTVCADGAVHAVKLGMLGERDAVAAVASALRPFAGRVPIVADPVLSATSGGLDEPDELASAWLEHIAPLATVLTPNMPELARLCGGDPATALARGALHVLVKGGHRDGPAAVDELWSSAGCMRFARPRLPVGRVRGTGCALASAIAARLAAGEGVAAACRSAGDWLAGRLAALGAATGDGLPRRLDFGAPAG